MPHQRVLIGVLLSAAAASAGAHGGGLNADGCHTNRKTGDYHCHRAAAAAPAYAAPVRSASATRQPAVPAREQRALIVSTDRPFKNCTEAREAGAAPIRRGEPGYGVHLDRDDDGIACE